MTISYLIARTYGNITLLCYAPNTREYPQFCVIIQGVVHTSNIFCVYRICTAFFRGSDDVNAHDRAATSQLYNVASTRPDFCPYPAENASRAGFVVRQTDDNSSSATSVGVGSSIVSTQFEVMETLIRVMYGCYKRGGHDAGIAADEWAG